MANAGFSVGTATGGGTFFVESLSGTLTPVGIVGWGGAGTATRVTPTTPLPTQVFGGTLNAGTVTVANTGTVVGTVAVSNTGTVTGTVSLSGGTISTIAAGTVVATAAGTQTVAGTVSLSGGTVGLSGGTVAVVQAGTLDMLKAGTVQVSGGTVVATAAGTQAVSMNVGAGKTLTWGTVNLTSGSVSLVNPGSGTTAYIVSMVLTVGTSGIIQFLQGVGAAALSGPMHVDQYGGFVAQGQPSSPVLKGAAGSQVYLSITSGIGTIGGFYSYFTE